MKAPPVQKFLINKGDYDSMRKHLTNVNWVKLLDSDDIDKMWATFEDLVNEAMNLYIPKSHTHIIKKHSFKAPPTLLHKLHLKRVAFKNFKRFPSNYNKNVYAKYRNQVKWECKKAKCEKEKGIAKECKNNPKLFYQYVNSKLKPKEKVSSLLKDDGSLSEGDQEKCEILNNFFGSVFTQEDTSDVPVFNSNNTVFISNVNVTVIEMEKALRSLKICKSPGPDGLHPRILKELSTEIAEPLKLIFDKTLLCVFLPSKWKEAQVRPIFKKGSKTSPGNYRPVSLTSVVCKLFESFIRDALFNHFINNNLLCEEQYGFCQGRSCTTQLLNTLHDWMKELYNNIPVDAVYLDFRKAFDTVPHKRLLNKLYGYGIRGELLQWVRDFLSNRYQYVSINNVNSSKIPVTSGVPQGSVLGPTLFIYFINDLPKSASSFIKIFADDTKAYLPITSFHDKDNLQHTINKLVDWSNIWLLKFNGDKCKVLHLGKNNPMYNYTINEDGVNKKLEVTVCEKDLGVNIDPLLHFDEHINITVKKARNLSCLIMRTITHKSKDIMVPLFKAIIRPILEYGNMVWYPYKRKHIDLIESIQRHYTRCIIGMKDLCYEDRIKILKLPSLEYRRFRGDMIEVYKITHKLYDPITTNSLLTINITNTRSHEFKLLKNRVNTSQYLHFFTNRIINNWNNLPARAVTASSLNLFKNRLDDLFHHCLYNTNIAI